MKDLLAFLDARLDEDEASARAATPGPWTVAKAKTAEADEMAILSKAGAGIVGSGYEGGGVWDRADAAHIARHDPARVLREVEAERAIIAEQQAVQKLRGLTGGMSDGHREWVLRQLAAVYSDHPDYDQKWSLPA